MQKLSFGVYVAYLFPYVSFSLPVFLCFRCVLYKQHYIAVFLIQSDNLSFIKIFNPLTANIITDIFGFKSTSYFVLFFCFIFLLKKLFWINYFLSFNFSLTLQICIFFLLTSQGGWIFVVYDEPSRGLKCGSKRKRDVGFRIFQRWWEGYLGSETDQRQEGNYEVTVMFQLFGEQT